MERVSTQVLIDCIKLEATSEILTDLNIHVLWDYTDILGEIYFTRAKPGNPASLIYKAQCMYVCPRMNASNLNRIEHLSYSFIIQLGGGGDKKTDKRTRKHIIRWMYIMLMSYITRGSFTTIRLGDQSTVFEELFYAGNAGYKPS
jgi:hypothetical protein